MAKTRTHPMDFFNKEAKAGHVAGQVSRLFEEGRQLFREEILSPLMGALKEADPDWEAWYDETIPEVASLKQIAELVEDRIMSIECADYIDAINTTRSVISTFYS